MYLVAHQDDCQMVVGVPHKERPHPRYPNMMISDHNGQPNPRQCTCEPQKINWERLLRVIGGTRHKLSDLYE